MSSRNGDTGMVTLSMSGGHPTQVTPDATIGPYAIHRAIVVDGWTVTHIQTGKRIWTTTTFQLAIRAAQHLDERRLIPDGAGEAEAWRAALPASERARIVEELETIAPRVTE